MKILFINLPYYGHVVPTIGLVQELYENEVYAGVPEMLQTLKEQGKKIILATSKPEEQLILYWKNRKMYPVKGITGCIFLFFYKNY